MSKYLGISLCLLALSFSGQDTEIKGARISLTPRKTLGMRVTIENRHESPLVSWEVGLSESTTSVVLKISGSDFSGRTDAPEFEALVVKPHDRRAIDVALTESPTVNVATLRLAVFEDGSYEGIPVAIEAWRKARQARIEDLRYWSGVLDLMPRVSENDLRTYLEARISDRPDSRDNRSAVRVKLQTVLQRFPSGPKVWSELDLLRMGTQRELAALMRQPPANTRQAEGQVKSAAIVSRVRTESTTLMASIENLRAVPIEAYGVEILDAGTSRVRSSHSTDLCVMDPSSPLSRLLRIPAHEIREIELDRTVNAEAALPVIRLSFVIFDDLVSEGSAAARDRVFRERVTRADDFGFALVMLSQVSARPPAEVYSFLLEKRTERAMQLQRQGLVETSMAIDELIRLAKESADRLAASASSLKEEFERVRARLLRHVGR